MERLTVIRFHSYGAVLAIIREVQGMNKARQSGRNELDYLILSPKSIIDFKGY